MKPKIKLTMLFLFATVAATAQRGKKQSADSLNAYREFAALGRWYLQQPLQMKVHFGYRSTPANTGQDSVETDMLLYYGKNDFYMQVEGMEQIANDSMIVMVNNETRMINLYPNSGQSFGKFQEAIAMFVPDSSLQKLAQQYAAIITDEAQNTKQITLKSREKITGTDLVKEMVRITYDAGTRQPLAYYHIKRSTKPIDSLLYGRLAEDMAYRGRLINARVNENNLFLVIQENITQCRFSNISHGQQAPPAREQDRVLRGTNGAYQPAKGYENYLVNREW